MGVRLALLGFGVVLVAVVGVTLAVMRASGLQLWPASCGTDEGAAIGIVPGVRVQGRFLIGVGPPRAPVTRGPEFTVRDTDFCGRRTGRLVTALVGVPRTLAVLDESGELAVDEGLVTGIDAFALRRAAYGDDDLLGRLPRRCPSARAWHRVGIVQTAGRPGGVVLGARTARGTPVVLQLRRDLRFAGRQRFGLPAPRRGDVVRVHGVRCPYRDRSRGVRLRADRLVLPPR